MASQREIELLYEIGSFRYIKRMWQRFLNPDFQNNAEHSFRVAWISLLIAKLERSGNEEKIIKMAMVHDLPESRCGDVDYVSRMYTERKEDQAVNDIFADTSLAGEMIAAWREFEERKTIEAQIVKDADNLDVELELQEQKARGHAIHNIWNSQRDQGVRAKLFTKSAVSLWDEIRSSNPFDWHLNGRNRLKHGDWQPKQ